MGRQKREETKNRNVRLPKRLWEWLEKAADDKEIKVNSLIWRLVEDYLLKKGYLSDGDRKRPPIE